MNARLFWKALIVQLIVVAIPFAILDLTLDHDFFEDWGWLVGPVVWLACSAVTGRILNLPLAYVLFSAVAGGVAGLLVMLATSHLPGLVASLLVFAASCGSYDPHPGNRTRPVGSPDESRTRSPDVERLRAEPLHHGAAVVSLGTPLVTSTAGTYVRQAEAARAKAG